MAISSFSLAGEINELGAELGESVADFVSISGIDPDPCVTLVIICAHQVLRKALGMLLGAAHGLLVVGEAETSDDGLGEIRRTRPNVALFVGAQGISGVEIADLEVRPEFVVLGLSGVDDDEAASWKAPEAATYISTRSSPLDAIRAIKLATSAGALSPAPGDAVRSRIGISDGGLQRHAEAHLTAREFEVLRLIEQGCTNKEIGAQLSIEVSTVKNHVHSVLTKLRVHRRGAASAWLRRQFLPSLGTKFESFDLLQESTKVVEDQPSSR